MQRLENYRTRYLLSMNDNDSQISLKDPRPVSDLNLQCFGAHAYF